MKKVIFLSLMFLIVIFHASSVPVGMDDGEIIKGAKGTISTELVVSTKEELRPSIVGFTYDGEVTSVDDNVTAIGADGINLSIDAETGIASNDKPVYLYYQIVSGKKFTISLYGSGKLSSSSGAINWYVDWNDGNQSYELSMTDDGQSRPVEIHLHDPEKTEEDDPNDNVGYSDIVGSYGVYELKISTDSIWQNRADEYSASLVVLITDASDGGAT